MPSNKNQLAIIIPAFNAEKTIFQTLSRLKPILEELPPAIIVIINDGSSDNTGIAAEKSAQELKLNFITLNHKYNKGYGAAQKTGFKKALSLDCQDFVLLHADGQYDPSEIPKIIKPLLLKKADVSMGSKIISGKALSEGMPKLRYFASRLITFIENKIFKLNFVEYHSGYMAYSLKALNAIKFETLTDKFHFDGEMLLCAGKLNLAVREIPIVAHYGPQFSSLAPLPYLLEIGKTISKYLRQKYFFQKK
jgi:glycosyltransferase involved in cell wall biosynthesis